MLMFREDGVDECGAESRRDDWSHKFCSLKVSIAIKYSFMWENSKAITN